MTDLEGKIQAARQRLAHLVLERTRAQVKLERGRRQFEEQQDRLASAAAEEIGRAQDRARKSQEHVQRLKDDLERREALLVADIARLGEKFRQQADDLAQLEAEAQRLAGPAGA